MEKKTFFIPNISCGHCVMTIQRELGAMPGITSVAGDFQTKEIQISWDTPATLAKIKKALAEINYPAVEEH